MRSLHKNVLDEILIKDYRFPYKGPTGTLSYFDRII